MKYTRDDFGRKIYDIPNRRVYNKLLKLSVKLDTAMEKAGYIRTACESEEYPPIINRSIRLLWMINNSLMSYSLYHQDYAIVSHDYGVKKK